MSGPTSTKPYFFFTEEWEVEEGLRSLDQLRNKLSKKVDLPTFCIAMRVWK